MSESVIVLALTLWGIFSVWNLTEKGLPQYIPRYVDVRPAPSVSGVVTAHASARQRGER